MKHFIKHVLAVAKNTFKETIRDKVLYIIVAFALVFTVFAWFLGTISLGEDLHVLRSIGMAGIYFFGLVVTVFLGTSLVYKEIERRTLYFILPKPITHLEFVIGKFFGLLSSVAVSLAGMTAVYLAVVAYQGGGFDKLALLATGGVLLEYSFIIALSIFFSTYAKPLAGLVYVLLMVYIGHSLHLLLDLVKRSSILTQELVHALYTVLPNLEKFNFRELALYGTHPTTLSLGMTLLYGVCYTAVLLYASSFLLRGRDL